MLLPSPCWPADVTLKLPIAFSTFGPKVPVGSRSYAEFNACSGPSDGVCGADKVPIWTYPIVGYLAPLVLDPPQSLISGQIDNRADYFHSTHPMLWRVKLSHL